MACCLLLVVFLLWLNVPVFVQVPRALVNLVEPLSVTPLRILHMDPSLKCPTWLLKWEKSLFPSTITWGEDAITNNHISFCQFFVPLCYSAKVKLGGSSESRGAQQAISGWQHDGLNYTCCWFFRHLLLLRSLSACCTTSWNPAATTLVRTSLSSSSLSSEKSLFPDCQSVTKLCFFLGGGNHSNWARKSISAYASSELCYSKAKFKINFIKAHFNCSHIHLFSCSGWPTGPLLLQCWLLPSKPEGPNADGSFPLEQHGEFYARTGLMGSSQFIRNFKVYGT